MALYLCNVGTSSSQGIVRDKQFQGQHLPGEPVPERLTAEVVTRLGGVARAVEVMSPFYLAFDHTRDDHLRRKLSAEVHSLVRCKVNSADRVVLFYSDTDDGEVSARLVEAYLRQRLGLPKDAVDCRKVPGLQVDDAVRFRREGVPNYFKLVLAEGERCGWKGMILNPTGGYKALVSYATLLGMMFGVPVCYIFDNGQELLHLPPLPVEIDVGRLRPLLVGMQKIQDESDVSEAAFWGKSPHELREQYAFLLEPTEPGRVTLSPIGQLVYERLRATAATQPLRVYLSDAAWQDLRKAPQTWDADGFLGRLRTAADVERYHHPLSDGSAWLKPGNTSDRYRYEVEGQNLLIYRILDHDEYDRSTGKKWVRSQYAPFTRFDFVN